MGATGVPSPQDDGSPTGLSSVLYSGDRGRRRGGGIREQRQAGEGLCELKARTVWSTEMNSRKGRAVTRRNLENNNNNKELFYVLCADQLGTRELMGLRKR